MMDKRDEYSAARFTEHSTLGDSAKRYRRDTDAFTAGAQYALDIMVKRIDDNQIGIWREYLIGSAADILGNVHRGEL